MAVQYKLDSFEGPLDLLLHLIDKAEVDIYNIPISDITNQYMQFIASMDVLDLDPTSEFLVMAATLLSIKSKMLLPKPPVVDLDIDGYDDEIDPREELVQKLIEYRKYKGIAEHLRGKELERSLIYTREPDDLSSFVPEVVENPLKGLHIADLVFAFQKALKKSVKRNTVSKIRRDEISVKDRIRDVLDILKNQGGKLLFLNLFVDWTREEIVVTFLAVLELMKMKQVSCYQHRLFDDIVIQYKGEGEKHEIPDDEIDY